MDYVKFGGTGLGVSRLCVGCMTYMRDGAALTDVNAMATDTLMKTPSRDLMVAAFPGTRIDGKLGQFETPLSIEKARRMLGYSPRHSWRA